MAKKDYYDVLGVSRSASPEELKKAFKKMAKLYHPDCNPGQECEDKFKEIAEAYQVLSDPQKRKQFDMFGNDGPGPAPGGWAPGPGAGGNHAWSSAGEVNLEDIFGGAGLGDIFGEVFGGRKPRGSRRRVDFGGSPTGMDFDGGARSSRDVEADVQIGFEEAISGGTHRLALSRSGACPDCGSGGRNQRGPSQTCRACNGAGKRQVANSGANFMMVCQDCRGAGKVFSEACPSCHGSGRASGQETITVKIPAGVNDGGRMRVPGKGEAGPDGTRGDLFLRVHVTPHRFFRRETNNLHLDVPVTVSEAALGAKIEVPTMEGIATLKIPAGTQTGAVLRLKGKGVASPKTAKKGDLLVHLKLVVPEDMDDETRELLEKLKEREPDPRAGKFN